MPVNKPLRRILALALLATLCLAASAQSYNIRVSFNTNIRAEPSLEGARLETVPAGTILEVLRKHNRWLRVNRGGEAWMAGWVSHTRVEGAAAATTDNCCGIDRQCQHQNEWEAGYWAFQRGECAAPVQSTQTSQTGATNQTPAPAAGDNCCGVDRQCQTSQQWIDGYWAYQRGQCGAPAPTNQNGGLQCHHQHEMRDGYWTYLGGWCTTPAEASHAHIRITELSAGFTGVVNRGFELLRRKAPQWYTFAITGLNEVRENHQEGFVDPTSAVAHYHHAPASIRPIIPEDDVTMAEFLVHEACHVHQNRQGRGGYGLIVEYECAEKQLEAAYLVGPVAHHISSLRRFLNDPHNRKYWWWSF